MWSKTTTELSFKYINEVPILSLENDVTYRTQISTEEKLDKKNITSQRRLSRTIEPFMVGWLDPNIDQSERNYQNSIGQLRRIITMIKLFTVADECVTFLSDLKDRQIFLILSNVLETNIVSLIHDLSQVHSIYILDDNERKFDQYIKEWKKVKGIFINISLISDQLKEHTRHYEEDLTTISIISPFSINDLNTLDSSFMYSQLLKEIFLEIEYNDKEREELIQFFRSQYIDNNVRLEIINEFEEDYHRHSPIWWYTKESIIYSMLNRALRTQDIEIIIKMGFFLRDLHRQIEQLYLQSNNRSTSFIVYRGQGISNSELEQITKSKGGLLAFNSFLSTSINREISLAFAYSARDNPNLTGILFQMIIDPLISSSPYASLDCISHFPNEQEVLFSMHTVFRIGDVIQLVDRLWQIDLILTKNNDQQLTRLTEHLREEIEGKTGWDQLGSLMNKMCQFDKAEEICKTLLQTTSNDDLQRLAFLHYQIGRSLYYTNDLSQALTFYQLAVHIQQKSIPFNHSELAVTYKDIGLVHCSMGNYSTSLDYLHKTLQIQRNSLPFEHVKLANTYNNIGWTYYLLGDYSNALSYCQKAVEIKEKCVPSNHPELAYIYDSLGRIYFSMENNSIALEYYNKTLKIQQKSLPSTHVHLATSYCNIGEMYHSIEDYSTALSYYKKVLDIREKSFSSNHPELAQAYNKMGELHYSMGDNSTALLYYQKTLYIQEKSLLSTHPDLAISYYNIALVYQSMKDYSTALSLHQKALIIQQKSLPSNHPLTATTHHNMARTLEDLHRYDEAVEHAFRAVQIGSVVLGSNHSKVHKYHDYLHKLRDK